MTEAEPTHRRLKLLRFTVIVLIIAAAIIAVYLLPRLPKPPRPNYNSLAIGAKAVLTALEIPINPPIELDYQTRDAVYALRRTVVSQYPELLAGPYEPADAVFGEIASDRPWWGMIGHFYYGSGEQSIEGASEESRFIQNPYLLVAAELIGFSYFTNPDFAWDRDKIPAWKLREPDFPFMCEPQQLRWQPAAAAAEVTYDVTACRKMMNPWLERPLELADAHFDLLYYNARDLNLNFLYLSVADSVNIANPNAASTLFSNRHYLHLGSSCGYPGGCNNMSPPTPETDDITITALPARAVVYLWSEQPSSLDTKPDMVFTVHFV